MKVRMLAVVAMIAIAAAVAAQPGTPAKTGRASFTYGGKEFAFETVNGNFNQSSGFTVATVNFWKDASLRGDHLSVSVMVKQAGPVDLNQPFGNGIGLWTGGKIMSYQKGKSKCTMTLTKVTPTAIEGTADCPAVNEVGGATSGALGNVKFSASTN